MSRMLSAYYFMGQDLCIVPQHIRNDMSWLAAHGFDAVCVGVHDEQLTDKQPRGLRLLIDLAHDAGIKVYAIPSRWCGLIAGWPTLTGHFAHILTPGCSIQRESQLSHAAVVSLLSLPPGCARLHGQLHRNHAAHV